MERSTARLIACKALNPFVSFDLLVSTGNGKSKPIADAEKIRIKDTLAELSRQDGKFGLHVVDFIRKTIVESAKEAGFSIGLSKSQLLAMTSIRVLVTRIRNSAVPLEEGE